MKKLLLGIALIVAFWAGQAFEAHRQADCNTLPVGYDFSDVVDETDFWDECDSTSFRDLDENSPEWMLNVIIEYTKWSNTK